LSKIHKKKITLPDSSLLDWITVLSEENNCKVAVTWVSKYNNYVTYDYEPFCTDGLELHLTITSGDKNVLNYLVFLYDERLSRSAHLEKCLSL